MAFIPHNSVTSGWFLDNQASPCTEAIALRLNEVAVHAPALWELERTDVLRTACLRQRMTAEHAQAVVADLGALPIEVDRTPARRGEPLALSLRFGLTAYDAAYLELALRLQLPIATRCGPLREAAVASSVGVVT